MRTLLNLVCGFTTLACGWLFTMFLILRHPNFEVGAAVSLGLVALGVSTIALTSLPAPPVWLRGAVGIGAGAALVIAAWAFIRNLSSNDFEGYILLISVGLVVQGVLTLLYLTIVHNSRNATFGSTPAALRAGK